jgi:hypothetical protein
MLVTMHTAPLSHNSHRPFWHHLVPHSLTPPVSFLIVISEKRSVPFLSSDPLFYGWQMTERKGLERKRQRFGWRQCHRTAWRHRRKQATSVTAVGWYHATTSNARRLVQWHDAQFELAHHSPCAGVSCSSTDKQQHKMCRWYSYWTTSHLQTAFSNFQFPRTPLLFT